MDIEWALNPTTDVLLRKIMDRDPQRRLPEDEEEPGVRKPQPTKARHCWLPPEAGGEAGSRFVLKPLDGPNPAITLTADSQPPEPGENKYLFF